jgi:NAD binding domain of 6-phosphogluconate dehydrogenase
MASCPASQTPQSHKGLIKRQVMKHEVNSPLAGPSVSEAASSQGRSEIGFVGLGHMGTAMAANLIAAGHRVVAYVRRPDQADKLATLGIEATTEFSDLFDREIVISMLPDDAAVRDVVFGQENTHAQGLGSGLKRGAVHLSMSTTALHCRRRRFSGRSALSAAVRQPWTKDVCRRDRSFSGKPCQAAWKHDDCDYPRDAGRSGCRGGLSWATPNWGQTQRTHSTGGEQCLAFIMTSRPGGDASVPYGGVFHTLNKARQDALNRCSLTNLAQEGWGPCRTWCVKAN